MRPRLRWIFVVLALLLSGTAFAQTRQDRAKDLFEKGRQLYSERRYPEALEALMQAYVLDPNPVLVYNIARIHQDRDDLENAVRFFENYLKISPRARDRAAVKRKIRELQKIIKTRPPRGYLTLESTPLGGTIRVDGLVVGQAPITGVPLTSGRHAIEVALEGYEPWKSDVAISGGRTMTLSAVLRDRPGQVVIETVPPGAEVSLLIAGALPQPLGRCPCTALLASGTHTIEVKANGFRPKVQTLEKRPGEPLSVRVTLEAEETTGELTVASSISGARVRVDGLDVGVTPLPSPVMLRAGLVEVEVAATGYEPFRDRILIAAGQRAVVVATLRTLGGGPVLSVTENRSSAQRISGWALLGTGIAGVVTGGALHTTALVREYDFTNNGAYKRIAPSALLRIDSTRAGALEKEELSKSLELGAFISYGIGGAALLTGIILLATDSSGDLQQLSEPGPRARPTPAFTPLDGGAFGSLSWTF